MTHPRLVWESAGACPGAAGRLQQAAIEDATGEQVEWFRPPFGAGGRMCCARQGTGACTPVMWNVTAHDWDATEPRGAGGSGPDAMAFEGNQRRRRGSNILLHDGGHR